MTTKPLPGQLTARMALSGHGYAAVIDGILDIRTAYDTPNKAARLAFGIVGMQIISNCRDPECECMVTALTILRPDIKIVPVSLEVIDG